MTGKFTRIRNIERATSFRLEYFNCTGDEVETKHRDFKSIKALAQWADRNDSDLGFLEGRRLALIDEIWEPFTTIGKKTITLSALVKIVDDLKTSFEKK